VEKNATHRQGPVLNLALSIEGLAAQQNVSPVMDFRELLGRPSNEDESPEEFTAMLREWRREGMCETPRK
jgi:hypothetical protein